MSPEQKRDLTTALTVLVAVVWLASMIVRITVPAWPLGATADALMLSAAGYWFSTKKANADG